MAITVHINENLEDYKIKILNESLSEQVAISSGKNAPQAGECDYLVAERPSPQMLDSARLKGIIIPFAGLPPETGQELLKRPALTVHNLHYNASSVAELALGLILAAAKQIPLFDRKLRRGDWGDKADSEAIGQLSGKRLLIVGYGSIGRRLAEFVAPFRMRITGLRNSATEENVDDLGVRVVSVKQLKILLPECDILFDALPGTEANRGIIGADELALLPGKAIVVNVGRGLTIDQFALYQALKEKRIAAAALDVWYNYPKDKNGRMATLPAEAPLHLLDNIVMTPHTGAPYSVDVESNRMVCLAQLLNRLAAGQLEQNRVDPARGY